MTDTGPDTAPRWSRRLAIPLARELGLLVTALFAYRFVRLFVKDEIEQAFHNSRRVIDWERSLGIFNELETQARILDNDAVIWTANRYYFFAHFIGTFVWVCWMFVFHHAHYGRIRRVLLATTFGALVIHVAFPLAPPRWFPELGFVDTLQTYGPRIYDNATVSDTANQIAAMPSLHVGWALIGAWGLVVASGKPWRWVVAIHPSAMIVVVIVTANHWWLDAVVAGVLVAAVIALDTPIQRWLERRSTERHPRSPLASTTPVR